VSRVADTFGSIPGLRLVRSYDRTWLSADGLAALTIWALLIPQALAYAQLGGFAPAVGLYAAVGALAGYALFGGVREMSVGPEATIALLTAAVVALAGGDTSRYLAQGAGTALLAGALLVVGGLLHLGFITRYLSRPLLLGYVSGVAVIMIISQLDTLLGSPSGSGDAG
jgi:SulP family sulfate permease